MKKQAILLAFVGAMMIAFAPAEVRAAGGILISPDKLPSKARTTLIADIEMAKQQTPRAFDALEAVRKDLAALDAHRRGRFVPVPGILKSLGKDGLMPMLEELAFRGKPRGTLTESAWIAWQAGVIEAVGKLRDGRAEPVLVAILDGSETEFHVVRAAAAALGRLDTDTAIRKLVSMSRVQGAKQQGVLAGMGSCRRTVIAKALADAGSATRDGEMAQVIAHSLGDVGSSWAWKTPVVAANGEERPTRATAARALMGIFVAFDGEVRKTASNALMVVDDPSTPELIESAKKDASAQLRADLDKLARRFARNPIRSH